MNYVNLVEINKEEAMSINGGISWSAALRNTWFGVLLSYVVDNYEDIKSGAASAYYDYHKK